MKTFKLICTLFLIVFFYQQIVGQPDSLIVPLKDSLLNKYGYVNKNDSNIFIIKPMFTYALNFHNNYARASKDSSIGLINKKGEFIIEPRFESLTTTHKKILIAGDTIFTIINFYGEPIVCFDYTSLYWEKEILFELPLHWEKEILDDLNDSTIKDGELIRRVFSMYENPKVRFKEMINISMVYDDFAVLFLEHLHRILERFYGKEKLVYLKSRQFKYGNKK